MRSIDKRTQKVVKRNDPLTLALILALVAIGVITMAHCLAEPTTGDMTLFAKFSSLNLRYPMLQLAWCGLGLVCIFLISRMDYQVVGDFAKLAYLGILVLLITVKLFGGNTRGVNGWFSIGSTRAFQPSEFGKIVLILILAKLCGDSMDRNDGRIKGFKDILTIVGITAVPVGLIAWQPDWGTAAVYLCIMVGILFAARMSWRVIAITGVSALVAMPLAYYFILNDDQRQRILTFLNPNSNVLDEAYHFTIGQEVIRSGGTFGKGLLSEGSITQLGYLPEKHTDYIFASLVEALGFVGGALLILIYFALIIRTLFIAQKSRDHFGMLICAGVASMMLAHIFENIGMLIGLMPITGIPLPFVSYGGSNMLANMISYGFVINVWTHRQQKYKSPVRMAPITPA
ncbi:MAG: FtsW/RodA/SpoVE family cell cycle protein [Christensenellales bacterium]|jgi:rod shape determining protein RodA